MRKISIVLSLFIITTMLNLKNPPPKREQNTTFERGRTEKFQAIETSDMFYLFGYLATVLLLLATAIFLLALPAHWYLKRVCRKTGYCE